MYGQTQISVCVVFATPYLIVVETIARLFLTDQKIFSFHCNFLVIDI